MVEIDPTILATFATYLLLVLVIGAWGYRRTESLADYVLGGRRLGVGVTALSAQASDMSGWLLLGLPGLAYGVGLEAIWMPLGLLAGTYANWRLIAPRLRAMSESLDNRLTIPDYLEGRFADDTRVLRALAALVILVFFTVYVAAALVAGARLFESVLEVSYLLALITGLLVIVAYTILGGFLAVSWTDALQGALMFIALVVAAGAGLVALGGIDGTRAAMAARNPELLDPLTNGKGEPIGALAIVSTLAWGLGYFGQPHILVRFMALENPAGMARARWVAMSWVTTTLIAAPVVGWVGIGELPNVLAEADREKVFIHLVVELFPAVLAGVALAGILAAVMSTADSQLLVAASAVSEDLGRGVFRGSFSRAASLWIGRIAVAVIGGAALVIAADPESRVLDLVANAWAGFGASFGPVLLWSLLSRRMPRSAAFAGMLVGAGTVLIWGPLEGGLFDLYELLPGFVLASAAIGAASLLVRPSAKNRNAASSR